MIAKGCMWAIVFFIVFGIVSAVENYMDYGNESPNSDKSTSFYNRDLYRLLAQRSADDSDDLRNFAEHLQPRAVERSPSLRLRFGRSYPKYPVGAFTRLNDGGSAAVFDNN